MPNAPIKDVVILISLTNKEIMEKFAKAGVVWLVIKTKSASVNQEDAKLSRQSTAQCICGNGHLLHYNMVILLLLRSSFEILPEKGASKEVD